jgi:F-type H+-transporting ATPase subunit b
MSALLLLASQDEGQIAEIARTFGVDWPHLGAQIISFCIVCALLYRFAYRHVLAMLEERRQQIALGLANAERIKAELDRTEDQRREVMAHAHAHATKVIEEARAAAARVLEQETRKALIAAETITINAREAAMQDHQRMLGELKREVGRLVVRTTAAVAGRILTAEDERRLTEETAKQVAM